ncbi:ABC transporter ATP-binding protein [Paenibacillus sp. J2TS4]|uniref:ABC transporter ATP-binding protein n=1 Tax=Paenibacillus sp. J2TS4 TaxID=2807194 RepID=UPI001B1025EB|nr:ABC transporter ATP-binding protein [Paenibacillus sp. J2TS4]GIP36441.1 ABC transporter ATP-binding protein [Paenibacillus sp. J2TS4]
MSAILQVKDISVMFRDGEKQTAVLNQLQFDVEAGQIVALIGRSGSGKTMTSLSLVNQVPPPGNVTGEVRFDGENLLRLPAHRLAAIRGKRIFTIFQNPMNSFNPSILIGKQLYDFARSYSPVHKAAFMSEMIGILERLNVPEPALRLKQYPFQLSGGMLQRMLIGLAVWTRPDLIIADEPTTALDPGVQKEILQQFRSIRDTYGTGILLITHHFGVVAELADHVLVLQKGSIVDQGSVFDIFDHPRHPYTRSLLEAAYGKEADLHADGSDEFNQSLS